MYGGGYIFTEPTQKEREEHVDDPVLLAAFEATINSGEKIEPEDWMPYEYRRQLIRLIEQHAHSEVMGALPEGAWITRAPGFRRKLALIAKVQDEVGHAQLLYNAAETLGKSREAMISDLLSGKSKYSNVFNYPAFTWADVPVIGFLIDAGAIVNQVANSKGSYGPYCRALERICYEESFHIKQGYDAFVAMALGTPLQREMVQEALNRWWKPIMHFFGPPDQQSQHGEQLMRWKVKLYSNDELRQRFIDRTVPQAEAIGIKLPDDKLKFNETTRHYEWGQINWDEFKQVVSGNGPCNKQRMKARKDAEVNGHWVREAASAYAAKRYN